MTLRGRIEQLDDQIQDAEAKSRGEDLRLVDMQQNMQRRRDELEDKKVSLEEEKKRQDEELSRLRSKIAENQQASKQKDETISSLQAQKSTVAEEVAKSREHLDAESKQLKELLARVMREGSLEEWEKRIAAGEGKSDAMMSRIRRARQLAEDAKAN